MTIGRYRRERRRDVRASPLLSKWSLNTYQRLIGLSDGPNESGVRARRNTVDLMVVMQVGQENLTL
jgi:hypothetical protein